MSDIPSPAPGADPSFNAKATAKAAKAYAKASRPWYKKKRFIIPIGLVALIAIGSGLGGGEGGDPVAGSGGADTESSNVAEAPPKASEPTAEAESKPTAEAEPAAEPEPEPEPDVPAEYEAALTSAENYLSFAGFSKKGLFDQLSSDYGDKFSAEAAQYAVDNVEVDWKAEALESAKNYMEISPMSPDGLRDQLTSDYGDKFTQKQADYAVEQVF